MGVLFVYAGINIEMCPMLTINIIFFCWLKRSRRNYFGFLPRKSYNRKMFWRSFIMCIAIDWNRWKFKASPYLNHKNPYPKYHSNGRSNKQPILKGFLIVATMFWERLMDLYNILPLHCKAKNWWGNTNLSITTRIKSRPMGLWKYLSVNSEYSKFAIGFHILLGLTQRK